MPRVPRGPPAAGLAAGSRAGPAGAGDIMSDATVSPPPAVRRTRRQRRPTGAPPPLPHRIGPGTTAWVVLAAVIVTGAFLISERTPWRRVDDRVDTWLLQRLAAVRTPWLTDLARWITATAQAWHAWIAVALVLLVALFRRWRHLLVLTLCLALCGRGAACPG